MRSVRNALIATGVACALVLSFAGVADAQEPFTANIAAVCNSDTGEYDLTTTFNNNTDEDLDFSDVYAYWENDETWGEWGLPDFTLPDAGTYDVEFSVPGDAMYAELGWDIDELEDWDSESTELDGDCAAEVSPTSVTPTTAAPTPTTAAATAAVAVTPAYTG